MFINKLVAIFRIGFVIYLGVRIISAWALSYLFLTQGPEPREALAIAVPYA